MLVWIYQSAAVVVLGLCLRYAALSWTGARAAMRSVPPGAADFAKLNGASAWQCWRHVHWPLIAPEMAAIWFVTYLLCLWDVETLVLIIPPGYETLAVRIFNLLHYGHNGQVNALCVILLGLAVLPIAVRAVGRAVANGARLPFGTAALACLMLVLAGCGRSPSQGARIQSAFFSGVQVIGSRGTALGQFNKPRSLTLDAQDNLYVVDMTGRVQKFSPDGAYLASWQMPQTDKGKPKGMCRDANGNIVVVEPHYTRVNHFTPGGKLLTQWGKPGTNSGQLCLPRAVAVTSLGDVVLCEYTLVDRVQVFSADGKSWKRTFGHSGRGYGELNRPEGLGVDAQDRVYVADSCNHRIQVFSPTGEFIRAYGHAGSGPGQLSYPYDVQIDHAGRQYVCEFGNSRIQIFDRDGKPLELLGGPGSAPGQFSNPWSVALDSVGNLYVADSQNHRVQKFIAKPAVEGKHTERPEPSSATARMASAEPRNRRSAAVP
jgi:sugar lactone lactonase YvrE